MRLFPEIVIVYDVPRKKTNLPSGNTGDKRWRTSIPQKIRHTPLFNRRLLPANKKKQIPE